MNGEPSIPKVVARSGSEPIAPAAGPRPDPPAGGWLRAARPLYGPLRQVRTNVVERVGRPVRCEVCGRLLFRALPFVWRGRLKVLGAERALVRADWDKMNRLAFRHVDRDHCKPQ